MAEDLKPEDVLDFYEDGDESTEEDSKGDGESDDGDKSTGEGERSEEGGDIKDEGGDSREEGGDSKEEKEEETLSGKTITLCGSGHSLNQFFSEMDAGVSPGDEVWAIDNIGRYMRHDRLFFMEHPSVQAPGKWLMDETRDVYVSELTPEVPMGRLYPVEAVVQELGVMYVDSSAAYALALAILLRASKVRLFGLDFDAEPAKRGCVEFLICKAIHSGVGIEIPSSSSILGNNLTVGDRLYGFKHSKDPFVMIAQEGGRKLVRFSSLPDKNKP